MENASHLEVSDMMGRVVQTVAIQEARLISISTDQMPIGIYTVAVLNKENKLVFIDKISILK
jgi:hypothetical protein